MLAGPTEVVRTLQTGQDQQGNKVQEAESAAGLVAADPLLRLTASAESRLTLPLWPCWLMPPLVGLGSWIVTRLGCDRLCSLQSDNSRHIWLRPGKRMVAKASS